MTEWPENQTSTVQNSEQETIARLRRKDRWILMPASRRGLQTAAASILSALFIVRLLPHFITRGIVTTYILGIPFGLLLALNYTNLYFAARRERKLEIVDPDAREITYGRSFADLAALYDRLEARDFQLRAAIVSEIRSRLDEVAAGHTFLLNSSAWRSTYTFRAPFKTLPTDLQLLRAIERLGDVNAYAFVRRMAGSRLVSANAEMRASASECLARLQELIREDASGVTLLRSSAAHEESEMLRAAQGSGIAGASNLLRSSSQREDENQQEVNTVKTP